ncbi:MAG: DNA translocase FtsK [Acidobacteriia bacterium]|nr:DNA translocase FtsK [Terriglobia bacterium]
MDVSSRRPRKRHGLGEVVGILLLTLAAVVVLALATYDTADPSLFHWLPAPRPTHNWTGWVGASIAEGLVQCFGLAAFLVPLILALIGWTRLTGHGFAASYEKLLGYGVVLVALSALLDLLYGSVAFGGWNPSAGGELVGRGAASALVALLGGSGAWIAAAGCLAAGIVLATRFSFVRAGETLLQATAALGRRAAARFAAFRESRRRAAQKRALIRKHAKRAASSPAPSEAAEEPVPAPDAKPRPSIRVPQEPEVVAAKPARPMVPVGPAPKPAAPSRQPQLPMEHGDGGIALPPIELLNEPAPQQGEDEKELLARARQITEKLREFALEGSVVAIHPGPVVTTFEFKPEAGVKYSKVTGLVDDLCLALKAESVRIDRMPGRSTIGVEVPNRHQETIYPRQLLSSERFRGSKSKLSLALGKDISGAVFTAELDRMPHLLIAGATGAGKSVGLNGMIASILYKASPRDVRFIMIDTKMIELGIYADIPHLLIPVVTDPKAASTALKWGVREMEQRYRKLASVGVRNLEQYNALLAQEPGRTMTDERTGEPIPLGHLPYVVIVIDEMADLMMVSSADVEESVMRLAQMARAVGIHMILATQRPSVDVITGTIKANFPARIAYRVSQRVDSRTIIDQGGAEQLLGRGDMLFLPSGSSRLVRLHGGFVTEAELNRITAFLKKQAKPVYDESVLKEPEEERTGYDAGERDSMFVDAVRMVLQEGQCSITLIQRRLRLGYARAARIVDMMEQEGIIGPADGSKPREVLVGPEVLGGLEAPRP